MTLTRPFVLAEIARVAAEKKSEAERQEAEAEKQKAEEATRKVQEEHEARIAAIQRQLAQEEETAARQKAAEEEAANAAASAEAARAAAAAQEETARVEAERKQEAEAVQRALVAEEEAEAARAAALDQLALDEMNGLLESGSDDYTAFCAMVEKYSRHTSAEVRAACAAVTARRDALVANMRSRLQSSNAAGSIAELEEVQAESEAYVGTLHSEIGALRDRIQFLRNALSEMQSLRASAHVDEVVAAVEKFAEPASVASECAAAMQSLRQHMNAQLLQINDELLRLCSSRDLSSIEAALAKYAGLHSRLSAGSTGSLDAYAKLREHRESLARDESESRSRWATVADSAKSELQQVLGSHDATLAQMQRVLEKFPDSGYGEVVDSLVAALTARREGLLDEAREAVAHALSLGPLDFATVDETYRKFSGLAAELESLGELQRHRDALLREGRTGLVELCGSSDCEHIDASLPKFDCYGHALAEFRSAVQQHRRTLQDSTLSQTLSRQTAAIENLQDTLRTDSFHSGMRTGSKFGDASVSLLLDGMPDTMMAEGALTNAGDASSAMNAFATAEAAQATGAPNSGQLYAAAARDLMAAVATNQDNSQLVQALQARASAAAERAAAAERDGQQARVLEAMKAKLLELCHAGSESIEAMDGALSEGATFGQAVRSELESLKTHRAKVIDGVVSGLLSLRTSSDVAAVSSAIAQHDHSQVHEIRTAQSQLAQHREHLIAAARAELVSLSSSSDVAAMDECLAKYEALAEKLPQEISAVMARRAAQCESATNAVATLIASTDFAQISQVLSRFPERPVDVGPDEWSSLQRRQEQLLREGQQQLRSLTQSEDLEAVLRGLEEYRSWGAGLAEELEALEQHRNGLESAGAELAAAIDELLRSSDLGTVSRFLEGFQGECPAVARREHWAALIEHHEMLLAPVLQRLHELQVSDDVEEITLAVASHEGIRAGAVCEAVAELQSRREILVAEAQSRLRVAASGDNLQQLQAALAETERLGGAIAASDVAAAQAQRSALAADAKERLKALQSSSDFAQITAGLDEYQGCAEVCEGAYERLEQWRQALLNAAIDEMRALVVGSDKSADVAEIDSALSTYESYGEEVSEVVQALKDHRASLQDLAAHVTSQLNALARSNDCAAIDAAIADHADASSPSVREARRGLLDRRTELVSDARAALRGATMGAGGATGLRALTAALEEHAHCAEALPREFAEAKEHHRVILDGTLAELRDALSSTDYRLVSDLLVRTRDYPQECHAAHEELQRHSVALLEAARTALVAARSSGDINVIDEALSGAQSFGEQLAAESEATTLWRGRLVGVRRLVTAASRSTDVTEIEQVLAQCESFGAALAEEVRGLREHRTSVEAATRRAIEELGALQSSEDVEAVGKALMTHAGHPAPAVRSACAALEARWRALLDVLLGRSRELSAAGESLEEVETVAAQLASAMHHHSADGGAAAADTGKALQDAARLLRARRQLLLEQRAAEIRRVTASDDLRTLTAAAAELSDTSALPAPLRADVALLERKADAKMAEAQATLRAACQAEDVPAIDAALERYGEAGVPALAAEIEAARSAREAALATARADVQTLLGSEDVPGLGAAYWRLEGWRELTEAREAVQRRWAELVTQGQHELAALAQPGASDLSAIDAALLRYDEWGDELVGAELVTLVQHRAELLARAGAEIAAALAGDDVAAVCEAAADFCSERWAGALELTESRGQLRQHAQELLQAARTALADAAQASDVLTVEAALAPYQGGHALASLLPQEVTAALTRRAELLAVAAREIDELARHCNDPAVAAAALRRAEDMPSDRALDHARASLAALLDALLAPHRTTISAHLGSQDIARLDEALAAHDRDLAGEGSSIAALLQDEWDAVRQWRASLVADASETLRVLSAGAQAGHLGTYGAVSDALAQYAGYGAALPEELAALRRTHALLLDGMRRAMRAAAAGDDVVRPPLFLSLSSRNLRS